MSEILQFFSEDVCGGQWDSDLLVTPHLLDEESRPLPFGCSAPSV
jgi:hypothetical protein